MMPPSSASRYESEACESSWPVQRAAYHPVVDGRPFHVASAISIGEVLRGVCTCVMVAILVLFVGLQRFYICLLVFIHISMYNAYIGVQSRLALRRDSIACLCPTTTSKI